MKQIKKEIYNHEFYAMRDENTRHVAREVFKILDLYGIEVNSVADVGGGGVGTFLSVAKEQYHLHDDQVFLFEGDYVDKNLLVVSEQSFFPSDLEKELDFKQTVDIAISLEVAEHLSSRRADGFVEDLVKISDCIIFSAAVKYQGGENHVNEQKLGYWMRKFAVHDYVAIDIFRPRIQYDLRIPFWYRQNMVLLARRNSIIHKNIAKKSEWLQPLDMLSYEMLKPGLDVINGFGRTIFFRVGYWLYRHIKK